MAPNSILPPSLPSFSSEAANEFLGYSEKVRSGGATPLSEDEVMSEVKAVREARRNRK